MSILREVPHGSPWPECSYCDRPATCIGSYERDEPVQPACDKCCGHGNEDGWCEPLHRQGELA